MEFNEYEQIIIRDITGKNFKRDKTLLKICFGTITAVFLIIYFLSFHADILKNLKFILTSYRQALINFDQHTKMLIYNFSRLVGFLVFAFLFLILGLFAFFAYDITARNRIIEYYRGKSQKNDAGGAKITEEYEKS